MPINEIAQKNTLFQKIGLGKPQMSNIKATSSNPPSRPSPQQPKPLIQPSQPQTPSPAKPGCAGCRRKRAK